MSQNEEFKAVRNAVVKAGLEVPKLEQAPQVVRKELDLSSQTLALLQQTANIFEDKLREYYVPQMTHSDRKLLGKIAEKKLAQGQKLGG